jgi:hypothetical protein
VTLKVIAPVMAAGETENVEATVGQQVQAIIPTSRQMVDGAIAVLSKGWGGLSPAEREAFLALYDPAGTGDVDERYVETVLANYQKIREELYGEITVVYERDNSKCEDMRLYYTDLVKLHVCPYFLTEKDEMRKARTLIHEVAHKALMVTDRPYYRPTNEAYAELTPNSSWMAQLPVVGPVIREIQGSDTQRFGLALLTPNPFEDAQIITAQKFQDRVIRMTALDQEIGQRGNFRNIF